MWIMYVDEIELSAQQGACYLDLGMPAVVGHIPDDEGECVAEMSERTDWQDLRGRRMGEEGASRAY
jgi:hypothetical protein